MILFIKLPGTDMSLTGSIAEERLTTVQCLNLYTEDLEAIEEHYSHLIIDHVNNASLDIVEEKKMNQKLEYQAKMAALRSSKIGFTFDLFVLAYAITLEVYI